MELDRLAANVRSSLPAHMNPLSFEVICPEDAIAATHGAIARRDRFRRALEAPLDGAAVAGTPDHLRIRTSAISRTIASAGEAVHPAVDVDDFARDVARERRRQE